MTETMSQAWVAAPTSDATDAEIAAIRATVLDYYEGWFDADAERVRRSVHPGLAKRSRAQDGDRTPAVSSLTAEQMVAWTAAGDGVKRHQDERALQIDVADVSGTIASVVVDAVEYVEYLHLVATPDGWQIINALWRYADGRGPRVE